MAFKVRNSIANEHLYMVLKTFFVITGFCHEADNDVHIFAPDGQRIGQILLPEICSNICFGGPKRNRLFMAASQSLYAVYVNTQGAHLC